MEFNERQTDLLAKYFADLSKILVASTVIVFFVPTGVGPITITVFLGGFISAIGFLIFSVVLSR